MQTFSSRKNIPDKTLKKIHIQITVSKVVCSAKTLIAGACLRPPSTTINYHQPPSATTNCHHRRPQATIKTILQPIHSTFTQTLLYARHANVLKARLVNAEP